MNTIRKLVAIDGQNAEYAARDFGLRHFPLKEFVGLMLAQDGADIIEILYTVQKRVPDDDTPEAMASVSRHTDDKCHALEMSGARTIICPAKRQQNGNYKQSDDQLLQMKALSSCLRLKPDFLTLVSGDDDMAPLVWELRENGVRTEVVAPENAMGTQLKRASYSTIDLDAVFQKIKEGEFE